MKGNSNRKVNRTPTIKTQTPVALREQIQMRAYQIWLTSGGVHGSDLQHWLQAEAEILKATDEQSGPQQ